MGQWFRKPLDGLLLPSLISIYFQCADTTGLARCVNLSVSGVSVWFEQYFCFNLPLAYGMPLDNNCFLARPASIRNHGEHLQERQHIRDYPVECTPSHDELRIESSTDLDITTVSVPHNYCIR